MDSSIEGGNDGTRNGMQNAVQFAFVGAVVPPTAADLYPGYSVAGNLWQIRLLVALQKFGFQCARIVSARPVPSFPQLRQIWFSVSESLLPGDLTIEYVPFINIGPIKTLSLSIIELRQPS